MSGDHDHHCSCVDCMGHGDGDAAAEWSRSYYVPDPPKIPLPPGASETTAPPEETGYTGPRFYTLLRGDDWNDPQVGIPAMVPYTFATRAMSNYAQSEGGNVLPGFAGTSGQPLTEIERASIRQALNAWEQVSGLTFIEVSDPEQWSFRGVRFLMESVDVQDLLGQTAPSDDPYGFNIVFNGFAYGDATLQPGTPGFWTALHEIGHAIGLKHPFDGDPVLKESEDNNENTVMSYTDEGNLSGLGPFDVAAVQHIYGAPEAKASAPIRWSHGPDGTMLIQADGQDNYVMGSVARDIVRAGAGSDYITTDVGDDYVVSGPGSDTVFGGGGADTLYVGVLWSQAASAVNIDDPEQIQGTVSMSDSVDTYYGVETVTYADVSFAHDSRGTAGQLYRLYQAAFGREPDSLGLTNWVEAVEDGAATMAQVASSFAGSAEFADRFAAPTSYSFVLALYKSVLGRDPSKDPSAKEAAEVGYWINATNVAGRGAALLGFSESQENRNRTEEGFGLGIWYPNEEALDVLRAYMTVLDRRPDADGLVNWTNAMRDAGLSQPELVARLVSSSEFQGRFGGLSNRDLVDQLYRVSLDRAPDADGLAYFSWLLDAGIDSRAGVALGFANSAEMTAKIVPFTESGALYA